MRPIGKINQIKKARGVGMGTYSENNPLLLKEKMRNYIIDKMSENISYDFVEKIYKFTRQLEEENKRC